jgi:hypothetical protein
MHAHQQTRVGIGKESRMAGPRECVCAFGGECRPGKGVVAAPKWSGHQHQGKIAPQVSNRLASEGAPRGRVARTQRHAVFPVWTMLGSFFGGGSQFLCDEAVLPSGQVRRAAAAAGARRRTAWHPGGCHQQAAQIQAPARAQAAPRRRGTRALGRAAASFGRPCPAPRGRA